MFLLVQLSIYKNEQLFSVSGASTRGLDENIDKLLKPAGLARLFQVRFMFSIWFNSYSGILNADHIGNQLVLSSFD